MVRFSDMLGGSGEPEDGPAANSPYAALTSEELESGLEPETEPELEPEPETDPETEREPAPAPEAQDLVTPEDVLDRLTQYATSARAADQAPAPAPDDRAAEEDATAEAEPLTPVGDDFLPHAKGIERRPGRSRKRRP